MPLNKTAEEIMVPINDYITISQDATIYEAIKVLKDSFHSNGNAWSGHRSVIVLDEKGKLVGVLTLRGLLKAAGLREIDKDMTIKSESWGWYYIDRLRQETRLRVRDVMRPLAVATVNADNTVVDIAVALLKRKVNSLPVLKKGKLVGMVRTLDIFIVLSEHLGR